MRKNSIKNIRVNNEVMYELSNIIRNEIKDPRLTAMVSVTDVKVTKDFITTNELADKVDVRKFVIGNYKFKKGYQIL